MKRFQGVEVSRAGCLVAIAATLLVSLFSSIFAGEILLRKPNSIDQEIPKSWSIRDSNNSTQRVVIRAEHFIGGDMLYKREIFMFDNSSESRVVSEINVGTQDKKLSINIKSNASDSIVCNFTDPLESVLERTEEIECLDGVVRESDVVVFTTGFERIIIYAYKIPDKVYTELIATLGADYFRANCRYLISPVYSIDIVKKDNSSLEYQIKRGFRSGEMVDRVEMMKWRADGYDMDVEFAITRKQLAEYPTWSPHDGIPPPVTSEQANRVVREKLGGVASLIHDGPPVRASMENFTIRNKSIWMWVLYYLPNNTISMRSSEIVNREKVVKCVKVPVLLTGEMADCRAFGEYVRKICLKVK